MAGRGRMYPANNGPRGAFPGPPSGPGLMHPVPGPFLPNMLPPHLGPHQGLPPMLIEQKLATQHAEIQRLLTENQRLAATHVALRQELAATQQEIQRVQKVTTPVETEKDQQIRALLEKVSQMEVDLRATDSLKADLEKLLSQRQELSAQLQFLTQESQRAHVDAHQITALKAEVDGLHQELQQARMACGQEKKASAEHLEQRQAMERNVFSMVREVEKLRAELANAEKRAQGATSAFSSGISTPSAVYNTMPLKAHENGYSMQQMSSVGSWGAYDAQRVTAASQEAVSTLIEQSTNHIDNMMGTEIAKYLTGPNSNHMAQQISQDHATKPTTDIKVMGEWSTHLAPNGKAFFYNTITGVTQWDKPAALIAAEAQALSQVQAPQAQEQRQQTLEPLLPQFAPLQQHSSVSSMNQGVQMQIQQASYVEQPAFAHMQGLQSASVQTQNSVMQMQAPAQGQSPHLLQVQVMQQPVSAQIQPTWLGQSPSGVHTQYAMHPSPHSQMQQQLGQTSFISRPGETITGVADEGFAQQTQLSKTISTGLPTSNTLQLDASGQALHHAHVPHVSAPPLIHPRTQASEVSPGGISESSNPVSGPSSGPQGANLFVFGIPDEFNDRKLAELFRPYGRVLYAKVGVERDTGRGKGYGFISMDSPQAAEAAIGAVNGMHISGKRIKVELKRGEHELHHQQQQSQQNVSSGAGPTRWHNRSESTNHRPY